jgi:hypothetical protein
MFVSKVKVTYDDDDDNDNKSDNDSNDDVYLNIIATYGLKKPVHTKNVV